MREKFFHNISCLLTAGMIVKVLGFVHKIVLVRILTLEGMNLYTLASPTIMLFLNLSSLSLRETMMRIVSQNKTKRTYSNRSIILKGLKITLVSSLLFSIVLVLFGRPLALVLHEEKLFYLFLAAIPLAFVIGIGNIIKGYFAGLNLLNLTGRAQVIEQITRISISICLAFFLIKIDILLAVIGLFVANIIGETASIIYLLFHARKITSLSFMVTKNPQDFGQIMGISFPLVSSHFVGSLAYFLEPLILLYSLSKIGLSKIIINNLFTSINSYIIPLLSLGGFVAYAISYATIPLISGYYCEKKFQKISYLLNSSLGLVLIPSIYLLLLCFFYPQNMMKLLYEETIGFPFVKYLSIPFLLYYLTIILNTALYACSTKTVFLISLISSIFKLAILGFLCRIPSINSMGIIYSITTSIILSFAFSLYGVKKYLSFKINKKGAFGALICFISTFILIWSLSFLPFYQVMIISLLFYASLAFVFFKSIIKAH